MSHFQHRGVMVLICLYLTMFCDFGFRFEHMLPGYLFPSYLRVSSYITILLVCLGVWHCGKVQYISKYSFYYRCSVISVKEKMWKEKEKYILKWSLLLLLSDLGTLGTIAHLLEISFHCLCPSLFVIQYRTSKCCLNSIYIISFIEKLCSGSFDDRPQKIFSMWHASNQIFCLPTVNFIENRITSFTWKNT